MNSNTGRLYLSREEAIADLQPGETQDDIVEIEGTRSAAEKIARAVQQARAVERRRAANRTAKKARKRGRR